MFHTLRSIALYLNIVLLLPLFVFMLRSDWATWSRDIAFLPLVGSILVVRAKSLEDKNATRTFHAQHVLGASMFLCFGIVIPIVFSLFADIDLGLHVEIIMLTLLLLDGWLEAVQGLQEKVTK